MNVVDERIRSIEQQIRLHTRSLNYIEEQIAPFGGPRGPVPLQLLHQRDEITNEIAQLQAELQELQGQLAQTVIGYEQEIQELTQAINKSLAQLRQYQEQESKLKQEEVRLGQKLAQVQEKLRHKQQAIYQINQEMGVLQAIQACYQELAVIQSEQDRGHNWAIQKLEDILAHLTPNLKDVEVVLPPELPQKLAQLNTSIQSEIIDRSLKLAEEQVDGDEVEDAIVTLEKAKSICDEADLNRIRQRLANLLIRRGSFADFQHAEEELRAIGNFRQLEFVLGTLARFYEERQELLSALLAYSERLEVLESIGGTREIFEDYRSCLRNISRLGSHLEQIGPGDGRMHETKAYTTAYSYFSSKRKDIMGLELVINLTGQRGFLGIRDEADHWKKELEKEEVESTSRE